MKFDNKEDCMDYEKTLKDQELYDKIFTRYNDITKPAKIKNLCNTGFGHPYDFVGCYTGGKEHKAFFEKFLANENYCDNFLFPNEDEIEDWSKPLYVEFETIIYNDAEAHDIEVYFYNAKDIDFLFKNKYDVLKRELTAMDLINIKKAENEKN